MTKCTHCQREIRENLIFKRLGGKLLPFHSYCWDDLKDLQTKIQDFNENYGDIFKRKDG